MFNKSIAYILLVLMVAGCGGGFEAANQTDTKDLAPIVFPDLVDNGDDIVLDTSDDPYPSSGSIFTVLTNLHSSLKASYKTVEMELDVGTVIGNHNKLSSKQGGDITLHFEDDDGNKYIRQFTSGGNVLADVEKNFWYRNKNGDLVWRGVFEGPQGALIVIVDGVYSDGDGGDPEDVMQGSVWFRPWQTVADTGINSNGCRVVDGRVDCKNPSGPIARCWKVSLGPYDCRFKINNLATKVTSLNNEYNTTKYVKIAEFVDLSKERTFKKTY